MMVLHIRAQGQVRGRDSKSLFKERRGRRGEIRGQDRVLTGHEEVAEILKKDWDIGARK
jgi:hypothetical protein